MFKPCIVVPVYNHGEHFQKAFETLKSLPCSIIIVDDGSDDKTKSILEKLAADHENITLKRLPINGGKGAAVTQGLLTAFDLGFTHALQVDADLQHNLEDIPLFLELSKQNQGSVVVGYPVFDDSVPKSRLHGRKFTNLWVCIETLSGAIKDAMCGFRVYPLVTTIPVIKKNTLSQRMGFDIEILVRLYWAGLGVVNQATKVVYPPEGTSNFRMFEDNLEISLTHTRLFFGMLLRIPALLLRKLPG